jgi:apolipoprotein N-acyltransferase
MNKYRLVALSITGGILSGLAWTGWCSGLILLLSFVPFFLIENHLFDNRKKYSINAFFIYLLPGFVIFSIIAIGWMRVASITGAIAVIMGLSFLMSFALWLSHVARIRSGNTVGIISLFSFWLGYEFLSLNVNIVSPWLNLGNGLAKDIAFIQWYEITGTAGGTIWILASNLLLTTFLIKSTERKTGYKLYLALWLSFVVTPTVISLIRYNTIIYNQTIPEEVVIVQPNVDPYTQKFKVPFKEQLSNAIFLAETEATYKTRWIITPETTVDDPVNLNDLNNDNYVKMIRELVSKFPSASVVSGMVTYRIYPPMEEAPTISARKTDDTGLYSDHFNSALKIDTGRGIEVYHKSKLVPGIEMQFSTGPGRFIASILPKLGGTKWGYGIQEKREVFVNNVTKTKIAPIICYESVFGKYVTEYVENGANALFIITNDGWWKNTYGYKQHLSYASLRAIETRRPVARSGNTGISCIINIRGETGDETEWWTGDVIKGDIFPESGITPYVRYGDYLLRIGTLITIIIISVIFIAIPARKKFKMF